MNYKKTTRNLEVSVDCKYIPEKSSPKDAYFLFAYFIHITNLNNKPVQLLSRHWIITDGNGRIEHVQGPGVVGLQPVINPGDTFKYSSFCPLPTPAGTMGGNYNMVTDTGEPFSIDVPEFYLRDYQSLN